MARKSLGTTRLCVAILGISSMGMGQCLANDSNPFSNASDTEQGGLVQSGGPSPRPKLKDEVLLNMTREDCEEAIRKAQGGSPTYQGGVDVRGKKVESADYKPGVDVRGNKVEGADTNGGGALAKNLPKVLNFNLDINVFNYSDREDLEDIFGNVTSSIGRVEYDLTTGVMTINGTPLGDPEADAVAIACMQALGTLP